MAKSRSIRDWTQHEPMSKLSANAERLFIRLCMRADDYGNFSANLKIIAAECFPLATALRQTDIGFALHELSDSVTPLIRFYEADDKAFIHILDFGQAERMRWPSRKWPPAPFEMVKEKSTKKEKEVEIEVEESENASTPPLDDKNIKSVCLAMLKANLQKYMPTLQAQFNKGEESIRNNSTDQEDYDRKLSAYYKKQIYPVMVAEFEKFFEYYTARNWTVNNQVITHKQYQWRIWLTRKK